MWGCLVKVLVSLPFRRTKLGPKTINYVFIGFSNASAAYKFLVFKYEVNDIHVNTIMESIDVEFFEIFFLTKKGVKLFFYKDGLASSSKKRVRDEPFSFEDQEKNIEPRRGSRIKVQKNFGPNFVSFMTIGEL